MHQSSSGLAKAYLSHDINLVADSGRCLSQQPQVCVQSITCVVPHSLFIYLFAFVKVKVNVDLYSASS